MSDIVVIGSLNADLVVCAESAPKGGETVLGSDFSVFNGGKGANQAFAAAKLGGDVSMLGRVGEDDYGRMLRDALASVGASVDGVRSVDGVATGVAAITVDGTGENRIVAVPGANGAYSVAELEKDTAFIRIAKIALFQLETPVQTVTKALELARASGCITILDPAPARSLGEDILSKVDYITPNLCELSLLSAHGLNEESSEAEIVEAASSLVELGAGKVLAKLGARGALLVDRSGYERIYAVNANVVDSTGAGDCFNGAFAAALSRGVIPLEAARFACSAASFSVTRHGAQSSVPSLEEVLRGAQNA